MEDVRELKELQLDALREVANIGAGHAATALSQMTNRTIMIAVPEVNVRALEDVTDLVGSGDEVLPLYRLRTLVGLDPYVSQSDVDLEHVVVIDLGDRRAGLVIDEVTGQEEIVVKQYEAVRDGLPFFGGATLLGDGTPSLIIDVSSLL